MMIPAFLVSLIKHVKKSTALPFGLPFLNGIKITLYLANSVMLSSDKLTIIELVASQLMKFDINWWA